MSSDGTNGSSLKQASSSESLPYLLDIGMAYCKSKTLFAALKLGVFELLAKSTNPLSLKSVVHELGLKSLYGTEAVLNTCAALGLLNCTVENEQGVYSITDLTRKWLLKDSNPTLFYVLMLHNDIMNNSMPHLEEALKSGNCQWNKDDSEKSDKQLDYNKVYAAQDDDWCLSLLKGFHFFSTVSKQFSTTAFDLSGFSTICDLGGGTGAFLHECARVYPKAQLILFELPRAIDMAPKFLPEDLVPTRLQMVKGDFFKDKLPSADLYVLCHIIHCWSQNEGRVLGLLKKAYDSLPKGGAVLVIERFLDEGKCSPLPTLVLSVMMTCAQEGRTMTSNEHRRLMEMAGFKDVQIKSDPSQGAIIGFKQ